MEWLIIKLMRFLFVYQVKSSHKKGSITKTVCYYNKLQCLIISRVVFKDGWGDTLEIF